jgi:hypothetical protein
MLNRIKKLAKSTYICTESSKLQFVQLSGRLVKPCRVADVFLVRLYRHRRRPGTPGIQVAPKDDSVNGNKHIASVDFVSQRAQLQLVQDSMSHIDLVVALPTLAHT